MSDEPQSAEEAQALADARREVRAAAMEIWRMSIDKVVPWQGAGETADQVLEVAIDLHLETFGRVATAANLKALAHRIERGER